MLFKREVILTFILTQVLAACLPQPQVAKNAQGISTTPLYTALPTSTRRPNLLATLGVVQTQTMQAMEENCDGIPSSYYMFEDESLFVSPDGAWQIAYCVDSTSGLPYTRLFQIHGEKAWNIPFRQSLFDDREGITDGILRAKKWSEDGKYIYLDSYFCCLDGPGMSFVNSYGLYQVNLETSEIKEIIPGAGYFAFSPDGAYLAGRNDSRSAVLIYNLKNDKVSTIPVAQSYSQIGIFSWSPDSQNIIFVGAFPDWENQVLPESEQGGFSLLLVNVKTKSITILLDKDIRYLTPSLYKENDWANNDEIFLYSIEDSLVYTFNIQTGQVLLQPTPTLNP